VSQTRPVLFFEQLGEESADFNSFWYTTFLEVTNLHTSLVNCCHLPWEV